MFTEHGAKLPSILTELYQQYVLLKLSLYNQRISNDTGRLAEINHLPVYISESLNKLGVLAYVGLKTKNYILSKMKCRNYTYQSIPMDYDEMGLLQVDNHMLKRGSYKIITLYTELFRSS